MPVAQQQKFTFCKKPTTPATPSSLATQLSAVQAQLDAHQFGTDCAPLEAFPVLESWDYLLGAQTVVCGGVPKLRLGRIPVCAYGDQGLLLQNVTVNGSNCLACS